MADYELLGNRTTIERLKKSVKTGELSHAYLFEGPDGIGKKTLARDFAKMIFCGAEDMPCNSCTACLKIKSANHPDLFFEKPVKKKSSTKAAYSVSDIEKIQAEMRRKPNESEKKLFIITEGERLSVDSQNKFLKTLEEPLESVITIILTNNSNKLLKTTVSRCQVIKLERLGTDIIRNNLEKRYGDIANIESVLAFSDGNMGKAIELLNDEGFQKKRNQLIEVLADIMEKDITKVFSGMKFFEEEKDDIHRILDMMTSWFRDLLVFQKTQDEIYTINRDKIEALKTQTGILSISQIYDIVYIIENTKLDIERNVNYQLAIELLLLKVNELSRSGKSLN